jgi:hypothetical protein
MGEEFSQKPVRFITRFQTFTRELSPQGIVKSFRQRNAGHHRRPKLTLPSWDIDFGMKSPLEITNRARPTGHISPATIHTERNPLRNNARLLSNRRIDGIRSRADA